MQAVPALFKKKLFQNLNTLTLKKFSTMPTKLPVRKDVQSLKVQPKFPSRKFEGSQTMGYLDSGMGAPEILET
jgi:hypothetical protein